MRTQWKCWQPRSRPSSRGRSSVTTIRIVSREPGDGLTGTDSGGSLDQTESVATWSRGRPSSLHPPAALLHPSSLMESSSIESSGCRITISLVLCLRRLLRHCNHRYSQIACCTILRLPRRNGLNDAPLFMEKRGASLSSFFHPDSIPPSFPSSFDP